jgi:ribonuclease P protein component
MIGRLLRKSDFERVLAVPACSRSAHFAVHFVQARPECSSRPAKPGLSTADAPILTASVDNLVSAHWLGQVIPKRHAARSVTRNMLRRQVRAAMERHVSRLRPGLWLVRLRQPFGNSAKTTYPSADSIPLRSAASAELDRLFDRAAA